MSTRAYPSALSVIIASGLLVAGLALATTTSAQLNLSRAATTSTFGDMSLASCPARKPVIRIAGVFTRNSRRIRSKRAQLHAIHLGAPGSALWGRPLEEKSILPMAWRSPGSSCPARAASRSKVRKSPDVQQRRGRHGQGRRLFIQAVHEQVRR